MICLRLLVYTYHSNSGFMSHRPRAQFSVSVHMPSVTTDVPVVRRPRVIRLEPLMTTGPAGEDESSILFLRFHVAPLFTCNQAVLRVRRSELIGQVRQQPKYITSFSSCNSKTPNLHIVKPLFGVCGGYTAKPLPLSLSFKY
jgi:hypothetical protein